MRLPPALIALSPGTLSEAALPAFLTVLRRCVALGLRALLLREPSLHDRVLSTLLGECRGILGDGWLGVHDRAHLAKVFDCDGLHLGFRSLPPEVARGVVGPNCSIGFSAHLHDEPSQMRGADYLFLGPVLATASKVGLVEALGWQAFEELLHLHELPCYAIGGMLAPHMSKARAAGARGIAVRGGLLAAADPVRATADYLQHCRLDGGPPGEAR